MPVSGISIMRQFEIGEQVRVDLPDETDPDFAYHGEHGEVVDILTDDAGEETGDERDSYIYVVHFEDASGHFRWRDLRPPIEE